MVIGKYTGMEHLWHLWQRIVQFKVMVTLTFHWYWSRSN